MNEVLGTLCMVVIVFAAGVSLGYHIGYEHGRRDRHK